MISRSTTAAAPLALALALLAATASAQPAAPPPPATAPVVQPPAAAPPAAPPAAQPTPPPAAAPPTSPTTPAPAPPAAPTSPPGGSPSWTPPPADAGLPGPPPGGYGAPPPPLDPSLAPTGRGGPAEPPGARLERLRAVLTQVDDEASNGKVPALIAGLIIGGVSIPTGIVMMNRDDEAQEIGGAIVLGTGIGSVLGGVIQLFVPVGATMDMGDELERAMASGAPADVVVRSVEQQWAQAASDLRTSRKISGGIGIGIGALALGGGTALALVDTGGDLSSTEQAVLASALIAGGGIMAVGGIQIFFIESPQEVAWSTYAAATGIEEEPLLVAPRLELGAVPGGAGVAFGAQF